MAILSTKERIIDASIDLFSENGYAETSIRDIAKRVEIKTSSIYYHFESKEAILNSILNDYIGVVKESKNKRKWHEKKDSMTAAGAQVSANEIMQLMFFKFEGPHSAKYMKIIKIICSEAIRNNIVRDHFRHENEENFKYIKSVLDCLQEAEKISKCDTAKISSILCCILFAFMHLSSIDIQGISREEEDGDMLSLLEYVLKLVMKDVVSPKKP